MLLAIKRYGDKMKQNLPFRNRTSFGKRIEYYVFGLMLKHGLDLYLPLVDDDGIDAVIKKNDTFYSIQVKARSKNIAYGDVALFGPISQDMERKNYYFIFYSEELDKIWVMSSKEFIKESKTTKTGANIGKRFIDFSCRKAGKFYVREEYKKYEDSEFGRLK